ncbi:DUF512 domain-containing protein [Eubacterium oxidoreducens]|uniref:Putative radical SAM enzyme, TIGR03279 family n=1 Tax=Eubacterium oxidoreducens TaxID=1732 RepID=A0A1G6C4Q7_EUBOX|nr:DUF512 domain-containing protein [Eubacterium oxidoreducens]SDB27804.1 putative radical SAM enzyme, TIGR03279 family [Eubacterium oxidoreducens]
MKHLINRVEPGSIAEKLNIEGGDYLVSISGQEMEDVFDYHYLANEEELSLEIEKADGTMQVFQIEKDYADDLGFVFDNGLMDEYRSCTNKCIFCFIDQMPPGMRDTLYFKDDDARLSFLQGNYITLTNMKEKDIERVIRYHMGPINISVQTMNKELRCKMLHNRFAGDALDAIERFYEAGIEMNGQIVLCKGVNDGQQLRYSLEKLLAYAPVMQSVSVVPAGLSKYREGLYPLENFTKEDAGEVIDLIEHFQEKAMELWGIHFVHASDEWYLQADRKLPEEERYDGYLQLENGVGMLRLLKEEFHEALKQLKKARRFHLRKPKKKHVTIATGMLAAPTLKELCEEFMKVKEHIQVDVVPIRNDFFGELITVSGLLTGGDLLAQLKEVELGDKLLLPCNVLRSGEEVFLDDVTLADFQKTLQVPVCIVKSNGRDLVDALLEE